MRILINIIRHTKLSIILACFLLPSCEDYLNVVPDNTLTLDYIFSSKTEAYDALAKIYRYLPEDCYVHTSTWLMGDEYINFLGYDNSTATVRGIRLMRGLQMTTDPLLGNWSGTGSSKPLYQGVNVCNIFLERIDGVKDMTSDEKAEWKAQVKFLKAYYHFLLLQKYGPIVIADKAVSPEATSAELFVTRSKVEDCFDYIIRLMDEALPNLMIRKETSDLGQVDQSAASAIKARVLLFRASPFYSGNVEYFGDFLDHDGQPFFSVNDDAATKKAKWKAAVDAIDEALAICLKNGKDMFTYTKPVLTDDREDYENNRQNMQTYYDLRMVMADPWNKELIWGYSNMNPSEDGYLHNGANIVLPQGYPGEWFNNVSYAWNWLGATYKMAERYYTKHGLPLDDDRTFDRNSMYQLTTTPAPGDAEYAETRGILQPNAEIVSMYLNREPRFYANLGITGTYWRAHGSRITTQMYAGTAGGYRAVQPDNAFCTGIGIQKLVHPNSKSAHWLTVTYYPYPVIRMADLYLMKAEALNEYLEEPNQEVWDAVNKVRRRAGIPDVETAWSDTRYVTSNSLNKHTIKEGMRDIILTERSIELAFEGSRFWDMLRYKRATAEFSTPVQGWMYKATTGTEFFNLEVKQERLFPVKNCLWPIDLNEMNTNANLIQNPGW